MTIFNGFYDKSGVDKITNDSIALLIYDSCFNCGIERSIKKVCDILSFTGISKLRDEVIKFINSNNQEKIFNKIKNMRIDWYKEMAGKNSTQKNNLTGWLNRVNKIKFVPTSEQ